MGKWARREMTMRADIVKAPPALDERFAQTPIVGYHHRPIKHDGAFVLCEDAIGIKHFLCRCQPCRQLQHVDLHEAWLAPAAAPKHSMPS